MGQVLRTGEVRTGTSQGTMMARPTAETYRRLVHTPAETAASYVQWARDRKTDPGITWGVPAMDTQLIPMHPGELICILGRPGHGKSSLLAYLARQQAKRIVAAGKTEEQCVVYVTWENTVEELANFLLADAQHSVSDVARGLLPIESIEKESLRLITQPIYLIGRGIGRLDGAAIRMTPEVVYQAIESMRQDFGVKPTLLLFDYLQLIPSKNHSERMEQVAEAPIRIKELAQTVGAPAVAAVQASRRVDTYKEKLPESGDAQWSSAIEQTSDKLFSLWRPILTEETATIVGESGREYPVTDTLLLVRKLKERFNRGRFTIPMYFEPAYLKLAEMELRNVVTGERTSFYDPD